MAPHRLSRRGTTLFLQVTCFAVVMFFSSIAEASISIVDTGRTFDSKPDRLVGQRLWKGYEYLSRLQYLSENPTLCPTSDSSRSELINVILPTDGLPVALLVQGGGGCTVAEKARVASNMIKPGNTVQYVIIIDEHKRRPDFELTDEWQQQQQRQREQRGDEEYDDEHGIVLRETDLMGFVDEHLGTRERASTSSKLFGSAGEEQISFKGLATPSTPTASYLSDDGNGGSNSNGDQIMVAILHVTQSSGDALMNIVINEALQVHLSGGTKILLNSRVSMVSFRTVLMWLLTTLIICSCACCCLLLFMQPTFEEEQPQAPPRPVRRRLTLDAVRTRFPAFYYNPEDSEFQSNDHHQQQQQQPLIDSGKEAAAVGHQHKYNQLSDECTICLDDFSPGDRCRELPCGHVFHSTCIARWLIERSAVCPLCKLDLFEEEEEDETDEAVTEESAPPSQPQLFFPWWSNFTTTTTRSVTFGTDRRRIEISSGGATAAATVTPTTTFSEGASEAPAGNDARPEADGDTQPTQATRPWWSFPLAQQLYEPATGTVGDEEEGVVERSTPSVASSRWRLNWFGQRRRRHPIDGDNNSMITELTEPLIMTGDRDGPIHHSENPPNGTTIPALQEQQYIVAVPEHEQTVVGSSIILTHSDSTSHLDSSAVPPTAAEV
jgi:hypothetical protein